MLLNEFLKEHKAFVEAQYKVDRLESTVATLVATLKVQATQIQRGKQLYIISKAVHGFTELPKSHLQPWAPTAPPSRR